jgi:hypothetical protein
MMNPSRCAQPRVCTPLAGSAREAEKDPMIPMSPLPDRPVMWDEVSKVYLNGHAELKGVNFAGSPVPGVWLAVGPEQSI